jgi:hypothetical protein
MKAVFHRQGLVVLAFCAATGWGCGKPGPKLVPVGGVVVNGDKPVSHAAVSFVAEISGRGPTLDAYGPTDGEGRFTLQTVSHGKGAPPGRYKVAITTTSPSGRLIPASITAHRSTPLVVDVPEGGAPDLKLDLSKYH